MSHKAALSIDTLAKASRKPFGASGSRNEASSSPISRKALTFSAPMPRATRVGVPNKLASTGIEAGLPLCMAFSNSSAGPSALSTRSEISVISSEVDTG